MESHAKERKEPEATFSREEIQQVRSSLLVRNLVQVPVAPCGSVACSDALVSTSVSCSNSESQTSCGKNARGLLRARLDDIIIDPLDIPDFGHGPVAMSQGMIPKNCHKILHLDEYMPQARSGTLQGSASAKAVNRCKAPLVSRDKNKSYIGNIEECKQNCERAYDEAELKWKPGGPELNLREYAESADYQRLSSGRISGARQRSARRQHAVAGESSSK